MNMQLDFHGKRVFVAAAANDLSRGVAQAFHGLGATVAVNGPTDRYAAQTIEIMGGGKRLVPADGDLMASNVKQTVDTAIAALGGLDVLICGFGLVEPCRVDDISEDHWERSLAMNLKSAFFTAQACGRALKSSRGCIVNVASAIGLIGGPPGTVAYSTAKGAMIQMTRMMALELSGDGVRVNCFCPGWTNTSMNGRKTDSPHGDPLAGYTEQRSPFARGGTIEEFAAGILHLASPLASYTTGTTLISDGGLTSGHYLS